MLTGACRNAHQANKGPPQKECASQATLPRPPALVSHLKVFVMLLGEAEEVVLAFRGTEKSLKDGLVSDAMTDILWVLGTTGGFQPCRGRSLGASGPGGLRAVPATAPLPGVEALARAVVRGKRAPKLAATRAPSSHSFSHNRPTTHPVNRPTGHPQGPAPVGQRDRPNRGQLRQGG